MCLVLAAAAGGDWKPQETAARSDSSDQWPARECGPVARRDAGPESGNKHSECGDAAHPDPSSPQTEVSAIPPVITDSLCHLPSWNWAKAVKYIWECCLCLYQVPLFFTVHLHVIVQKFTLTPKLT